MESVKSVNEKPLISVLMTAYNRQQYIRQAIESVLLSTYPNFELIIVDDGSKDDTVKIARAYAETDVRVKVFVNEKNLGDYPNRNKAASYATGKYLKYLDSDDYIYPWGLELLIKMMEGFPDAGWGLCSLPQDFERPHPFQLNSKQAYEYHYFGPGLFHKSPLSSIFNRESFEKLSGFSDMRMVGDTEMWHRMALHFPVVLMCDGIVWYREHDSQEVNSKNQFLLRYEEITLRYLRDPLCPLSTKQARKVKKMKRQKTFKYFAYSFIKLDFGFAIQSLKIWWVYLWN